MRFHGATPAWWVLVLILNSRMSHIFIGNFQTSHRNQWRERRDCFVPGVPGLRDSYHPRHRPDKACMAALAKQTTTHNAIIKPAPSPRSVPAGRPSGLMRLQSSARSIQIQSTRIGTSAAGEWWPIMAAPPRRPPQDTADGSATSHQLFLPAPQTKNPRDTNTIGRSQSNPPRLALARDASAREANAWSAVSRVREDHRFAPIGPWPSASGTHRSGISFASLIRRWRFDHHDVPSHDNGSRMESSLVYRGCPQQ